jgi:hypothetical protein
MLRKVEQARAKMEHGWPGNELRGKSKSREELTLQHMRLTAHPLIRMAQSAWRLQSHGARRIMMTILSFL